MPSTIAAATRPPGRSPAAIDSRQARRAMRSGSICSSCIGARTRATGSGRAEARAAGGRGGAGAEVEGRVAAAVGELVPDLEVGGVGAALDVVPDRGFAFRRAGLGRTV